MARPNIVWITTHDINPHLGCYRGVWPGAEAAVTPHLDSLAAAGARYDHAFATAPVCSPSRSSVMTGCYPTAIGTMHHRTKAVLPPEVHLLPEYFRAAGYYTTTDFFMDYQVATPPTTFDDSTGQAHWRNRPTPDTPFFSAFHGHITHESQLYLDDDAFVAATSHVAPADRHDPAEVVLPPYHPDTDAFRTAWARYLDLITEMDHSVGRVLAQLDEDGLTDSTIVVFWSDHGLGMPRGKRWVNESGVREPLIIRWPGRIQPGTVRTELVTLMDLAPTMLAAGGLPAPEHMHGVPLLTADGTHADDPHPYVFSARDRMDEQEDTSRSVRDPRFRYLRHLHPDRSIMQHCDYPDRLGTWRELRRLSFAESEQLARGGARSLLTPLQRSLVAAGKPEHELYDLVADPYEEHDLADDPAYADTVHRLSGALTDWQRDHGDLGLLLEEDLLERWRPGGVRRRTAPPVVTRHDGTVELSCPTEGATLGWTTGPPLVPHDPDDPDVARARTLGHHHDGRRWNLYTEPFTAPPGQVIRVGAWRIGYDPSDEVTLDG